MMDDETKAKGVQHNIPINATPAFCNETDAGKAGMEIYKLGDSVYLREA